MLKKLPKRACPELAEGFNRSFIVRALHATKLWLLYAVLFCSMSCKYVGVAEGNLFFFGGGERGEGKALLQSLVLVRVERSANVLFPLRWTLQFVLLPTSEECKITSLK